MTDYTELLCNRCNKLLNIREFSHANVYKLKEERKCKQCSRIDKVMDKKKRRKLMFYRFSKEDM